MRPHTTNQQQKGQELLSLEMAAARLGVALGRIRSMIACGALRTLNIGGAKFIPEGELDRARQRMEETQGG